MLIVVGSMLEQSKLNQVGHFVLESMFHYSLYV